MGSSKDDRKSDRREDPEDSRVVEWRRLAVEFPGAAGGDRADAQGGARNLHDQNRVLQVSDNDRNGRIRRLKPAILV